MPSPYREHYLGVIKNSTVSTNGRGSKIRTFYSKFKMNFKIETYSLSQDLSSTRKPLTEIRVGAQKLANGTGRPHRPVPFPVTDSSQILFAM